MAQWPQPITWFGQKKEALCQKIETVVRIRKVYHVRKGSMAIYSDVLK
jgi:hypothetical protein